jgi:hypothetical protein
MRVITATPAAAIATAITASATRLLTSRRLLAATTTNAAANPAHVLRLGRLLRRTFRGLSCHA